MKPAAFPPLPTLHVIYEKGHPLFQTQPKPKAKAKTIPKQVDIKIKINAQLTVANSFPTQTQASESSALLPHSDDELEHSDRSDRACCRFVIIGCVGVSVSLLIFCITKLVAGMITCSTLNSNDSC